MSRGPFVIAVLSLAACTLPLSPDPSRSTAGSGVEPLRLERLPEDPFPLHYTGIVDSARIVVRDGAELERVWSAIWAPHRPTPPLPAVELEGRTLIVAAAGRQRSGGHSVAIDSAYLRSDHVEVVVRRTSPGPRCFTTAALTEPVDLAILPVRAERVRFREVAVVRDC